MGSNPSSSATKWYTGLVDEYIRKPNTVCIVCGKAIYKRPSQIKLNHGNVFCSSNCYGIYNRRESPCIVCGKPILAQLNKKTCSRECANKNRAGIKYKQGSLKDKVKTYIALKKRLSESRGTICEVCGYSKFEILQVHHIDHNRQNNELRNLKLICPNCHFESHYNERLARRTNVKSLLPNTSKLANEA